MPIALPARMDWLDPTILEAIDNPAAIVGFVAAAVVGVASSLHCFLMCGPLACSSFVGRRLPDEERRRAIFAYQGGRIAAYTLVGTILGAAGGAAATALTLQLRPWLPWVMAALLVATAFDLGKKLPALPGLGRITSRIGRASAGLSPVSRSGVIGALTPLLPCGLLYGVLAAALVSGGAGAGASIGLGFSLGSAPALLAAQLQAGLLRKLPRGVALAFQRGVPLFAAAMIVFRVLKTSAGEPSCH